VRAVVADDAVRARADALDEAAAWTMDARHAQHGGIGRQGTLGDEPALARTRDRLERPVFVDPRAGPGGVHAGRRYVDDPVAAGRRRDQRRDLARRIITGRCEAHDDRAGRNREGLRPGQLHANAAHRACSRAAAQRPGQRGRRRGIAPRDDHLLTVAHEPFGEP
jgi:hypothetical protein